MSSRLGLALAVLASAVLTVSSVLPAQEPELDVLVGYSFDEDDLATGPDTFAVFENSKGSVELTTELRISGYHAIEIRDVPRDRDFPELQGYFPLRDHGQLWGHFALLLTDPAEELNIALAGPRWFRLGKDGIAFWLTTRDGQLVHVSDSIPRRLLRPVPFRWYLVDLILDIDAGTYDLWIAEEGAEDEYLVALRDQPNASAQPGSAVDKFSFIGDRGRDTSAVVYYVDDVVLAVGEPVEPRRFAAPGRRRFFVEALDDLRDAGSSDCVPAFDLSELGIDASDRSHLRLDGSGASSALVAEHPSAGANPLPAALTARLAALVAAHRAWREGCELLAQGRAEQALEPLARALDASPDSRPYEAAWALALAHGGRQSEADDWLRWLEQEWADDPRLTVLLARAARARGSAVGLERLEREAFAVLDQTPSRLLAGADQPRPTRHRGEQQAAGRARLAVRQALVTSEYFASLLWQERFADARSFALAVAQRLAVAGLDDRRWRERAGDAAFHDGRYAEARDLYRSLLAVDGSGPRRMLLKLSDVSHQLGDADEERALREAIYGSLAR